MTTGYTVGRIVLPARGVGWSRPPDTEPPEPTIVSIFDGVYAQRIEKVSPLPRHLDVTEHEGHVRDCRCVPLLRALRVRRQSSLRVLGSRHECLDADHDRRHWLSGTYAGMDLVLAVCIYCWCVEVRDVSFSVITDSAPDGRTLRLTPLGKARRKSDVLGIYSGRRPAGRVYL